MVPIYDKNLGSIGQLYKIWEPKNDFGLYFKAPPEMPLYCRVEEDFGITLYGRFSWYETLFHLTKF
jgi:hypothetical protein